MAPALGRVMKPLVTIKFVAAAPLFTSTMLFGPGLTVRPATVCDVVPVVPPLIVMP